MAPFRKLKTYQRKKGIVSNSSENAFNDILAKNLSKRLEESGSFYEPFDTTFDRLLKGKTYNNVMLAKFPRNYKNSSQSSSSNSNDFNISKQSDISEDNFIKHGSSNGSLKLTKSYESVRSPVITRSSTKKPCDAQACINNNQKQHSTEDNSPSVEENSISSLILEASENLHLSHNEMGKNESTKIDSKFIHIDSKIDTSVGNTTNEDKLSVVESNSNFSNKNGSSYSFFKNLVNEGSTPKAVLGRRKVNKRKNYQKSLAVPSNDIIENAEESKITCNFGNSRNTIVICPFPEQKSFLRLLMNENGSTSQTSAEWISSFHFNDVKDFPLMKSIDYFKNFSMKMHHKNNLSEEISIFSMFENTNIKNSSDTTLPYSKKMNESLITSTPMRASISSNHMTEESRSRSILWKKSDLEKSPLNESYEIIKRWNHTCPNAESFTVKKLNRNNSSKEILKIFLERNKVKDVKLRKKPVVVLNRVSKLHKKYSHLSSRIKSVLKRSHKHKYTKKKKRQSSKTNCSRICINSFKKIPIVLLTPLDIKKLKLKSKSFKSKNKFSKTNSHTCSKNCICFKKMPKVLLTRFSGLLQNVPSKKYSDSDSFIDLTSSCTEDEDLVSSHRWNDKNDSMKNVLKDCRVHVEQLDLANIVASRTVEEKEGTLSKTTPNNSHLEIIVLEDSDDDCDNSLNKAKDIIADKYLSNVEYDFTPLNNTPSRQYDSTSRNHHNEGGSVSCVIDNDDMSSEDCFIIEPSRANDEDNTCYKEQPTSSCQLKPVLSEKTVEDSILIGSEDEDIVEASLNAIPMKLLIPFPAGKKFRRSMSVFKNEEGRSWNVSGNGSICPERNEHRTSVRVVPKSPLKKKRLSELEEFAINHSGYASRKETQLEDISQLLPGFVSSSNSPGLIKSDNTARNIVLRRCGQSDPISFEQCYPPSLLKNCQKIGEGVYGEVFLLRDRDGSTTVIKIIPIEGSQIVNLEKQKTFEGIMTELIVSMELSNLRDNKLNFTNAFTEVKRARCVQGSYPERLLELWELYHENKGSENDCPDIFLEDQLYISLELSNGGRDLEAYHFRNAQQSLAVFKQVTCALAVAEYELKFEHRDLHWGNVLVSDTTDKDSVFIFYGREISIDNCNVKATIIDFTFSRIEHDGVILYDDLATDEDLFSAEGDYQFEIYRLMRKNNENDWQSFKPYSNILWLHYILDKAINGFHYKNPKSKLHKNSLAILKQYKDDILGYNSASSFVLEQFVKI